MPDGHLVPVPRPGARLEELDRQAVVYNRTGKPAINLNETATVVWMLCDGERTVGDIAALLAQRFPESAAAIESDISAAIDKMVAARVMTVSRPRPVDAIEPQSE